VATVAQTKPGFTKFRLDDATLLAIIRWRFPIVPVFLVVSICLFVAGYQLAKPTPPSELPIRGKYPAPTTKYNGRTAGQWGEQAKDANEERCFDAAYVLHLLGAEGVPFLLEAIQAQKNSGNIGHLLVWLDGRLVDKDDLWIVAQFLDDSFQHTDNFVDNFNLRGCALGVIKEAGPKASPFIPQLRHLAEGKAGMLSDRAREILAVLESPR
jgi:hypothetical protein